jgi:hypothetical protein
MAKWSDLALWRGPTPNRNTGGQTEVRGLVVHIAEGWYEGTMAWQMNPDAKVSSHFVVARDGRIAQMVDTADAAWAQRSGNGEWLSVECEGFTKDHSKNPGGWEKLTDAQLDAVAALLRKCHQVYDVPLQTTSSTTGRGLGHHSMGADWGHQACPGRPIIAQKPTIVKRALALQNGDDDMNLTDKVDLTDWTEQKWGVSERTVEQVLGESYTYSRNASDAVARILQELGAQRKLQEAILAAFKGLNTSSIIDAVNTRSAEDAARDTELLAAVNALAADEASVQAVVDEITRRLENPDVE